MPGVRVSLSAGTGPGSVRTDPVLETIETSEAFYKTKSTVIKEQKVPL